MARREDAFCGLYCGACPIFMKTREGKIEELAAVIGLPVAEVACNGCKSEQVAKWCRDCQLKKCAREKNYETCIECRDYLCEDLIKFRDDPRYPYHTEVEGYLAQIEKEGTQAWLVSMKERWSCPKCKKAYNWFEQTCGHCGSKVKGYKKPE